MKYDYVNWFWWENFNEYNIAKQNFKTNGFCAEINLVVKKMCFGCCKNQVTPEPEIQYVRNVEYNKHHIQMKFNNAV